MANTRKSEVLRELQSRFGEIRKLPASESLFVVGADAARVYFRYSKLHPNGRTFFGLRDVDLRQLEGHNSFLCFVVDVVLPPILIPYADFEHVFAAAALARDGQYKAQLSNRVGGLELYVAGQGRFNVEGYVGFDGLGRSLDAQRLRATLNFTHSQIQTLVAGIGSAKGYEVYVPEYDVAKLDWSLTPKFTLRRPLPDGLGQVRSLLREIDVVWLASGRRRIEGLYEIEHSTAVYSGLLRFNDVLLTEPGIKNFSIISNDTRRDLFSRQVFRPTFRRSGLADTCSFLEYANVYSWHQRLVKRSE